MNKRVGILLGLCLAVAIPSAFGQVNLFDRPIHWAITSDILWLVNNDYQLEVAGTVTEHSVWMMRLGYTHHREGQGGLGEKYWNNKGRWYLGFRWRGYYLFQAPHLVFVSLGFDNRPQDALVAPTADVGGTLNFKPVTVSLLYSVGYEIYIRGTKPVRYTSRWVYGPEIRLGFCF